MKKQRTNMYFSEEDRAFIALIKVHYNLASDAAAVRLAIKQVASEVESRQKRGKDAATR